ncbi:MAG: CARDB domain-containing protein, partial [Candidatus Poseidoniales archaeon]
MIRFRPVVLGLIFLMLAAPLTGMVSQHTVSLSEYEIQSAEGWDKDIDVPTWRIDDEWVYETKFDVAQLIAQANVSATLNTLTGDTAYTVDDILFTTVNGTQTLAYALGISGEFNSATSSDPCGAVLDGNSGRLDIDYSGDDLIRVRDLAVINSEFTLDVKFVPCFFGSPWTVATQDIAEITFDTNYSPPKEQNDFPLHTGDQWHMPFYSATGVDGTSAYFDPTEFDTEGPENNSWQITANGVPTDGVDTIQYTGCDDSYKINEWNETGVSLGYNWYCSAVRYNSWMQLTNPAGFTIDWLLKSYTPSDSWGVQVTSSPGARNVVVDVDLQFLATLPDSEQTVSVTYETSPGAQPQANKNMQVRYESTNLIASPTTDGSGMLEYSLNITDGMDTTPSSDDYSSNGVIVWDPVTEMIGAATVVIDLNVVAIDLVAQSDSIIASRTRGTDVLILNQAIGYSALPGDMLSFSIPAQNRGVLASPATEIEVITPDGVSIRESVPSIPSYSEQRITVNWTIPEETPIGNKTLSFTVDPDELVTEDANRSNNAASIGIFIGSAPTGVFTFDEGKYTFENVILNASGSFDEDGGDVDCQFELESRPGTIEVLEAPGCVTQWNWSDDGDWNVKVTVYDEELDEDIIELNVTVLNRAPYLNLSMVESIDV